jgi:hypothetical protein
MYKLWYKINGIWEYKSFGSYSRTAFRELILYVINPSIGVTNVWLEYRCIS